MVNQGEESISQIAKEAKCSYVECITKIKYLKKNQYIKWCFVDHINGYVKKCSEEEEKLLNKYYLLLCGEHLQFEEIANRVAKPTDNITSILANVHKDIIYLIDKELVVGVEYNENTDKLEYYDINDSQNIVSINCPSCGAIVDINKGSKKKCEYCNSLIKYKSSLKKN